MKKLLLLSSFFLIISCQQKSKMDPNVNPFFQEWTTEFEVPPFLDIKDEHYMPAYKKGMEENLKEIDFNGIYFRNDIGHQVRKNFSKEN